jgi:hypothetical protein
MTVRAQRASVAGQLAGRRTLSRHTIGTQLAQTRASFAGIVDLRGRREGTPPRVGVRAGMAVSVCGPEAGPL